MAEKRSANAQKLGTLAVSFFVSVFFAVAIPISVFAAAYGAGTYGNGLYGSGDDTAPSVSLTGPSDGSTVSGVSVSLTATATDNISVVGVQFKLDGSTNIVAEDTTNPYGVTWDSTGVADGSHTLSAVARDSSGNVATSTITVTVDNTAPVRSAGSPSGTLALNTTSTTLSLTTNEAATCKYSTSPGTAYGSMTAFTTTGSISHSTSVSGLANGGSYVYYVKCLDIQSNTNATDYTISFTVAADSTSPVVSVTAPLNNATVSGSGVTISADATDDVSVAGVQFKLDTNTAIGAEDTSFPYSLTWNSTGISDGIHTIIAVARDGTGNYATSSIITITVDNTAPVRSAGSPSGSLVAGTTATTLSLTTDEAATCKYSTSAGTAFGSMTAFTTTGGTSHSSAISGLSPASYSYYVKCSDAQSNINAADYTISFSVAADTTPPVISAISSGIPGQAGTTITWTTDENADSQVVYGLTASYGSQTTLDPILGTAHGVALTGLAASTTYHFAAVSKDASGNTATSSDQTFTTAANDTAAIAEHNRIVSGGGGIISGPLSIGFHVAIPDTTASSSSTGVSGTVVGRAATSAGPGLVNPGSSSIYLQQNRQLYDRGEDIRSLQKFLNLQGFIVAQRGPGSMGNETSIFGTHTYRAVVQFQSAHGLPATGFLGPLTRGTINGQ